MQMIGREDELVQMNRKALEIARQVADETDTLMAGNLSNTTIFTPNDPEVQKNILEMYKVCLRLSRPTCTAPTTGICLSVALETRWKYPGITWYYNALQFNNNSIQDDAPIYIESVRYRTFVIWISLDEPKLVRRHLITTTCHLKLIVSYVYALTE